MNKIVSFALVAIILSLNISCAEKTNFSKEEPVVKAEVELDSKTENPIVMPKLVNKVFDKELNYKNFDTDFYQKNDYYYLALFLFNLAVEKLKVAKAEKKDFSKAIFTFTLANIFLDKIDDASVNDFWQVSNLGYIKTNTSWERQRKLFSKLDDRTLAPLLFDSLEEQKFFLKLNEKLDFDSYLGVLSKETPTNKKFPKDKLELFKKIILSKDEIGAEVFQKLIIVDKNYIKQLPVDNKLVIEKKLDIKTIKPEETTKPKTTLYAPSRDINEVKPSVIPSNTPNQPKPTTNPKESTVVEKKVYPENETELYKSLDKTDFLVAKIAWKYFEKAYREKTGLFDSAFYYDKTTMWDMGSALAGIVCANKLNIIDNKKTDLYLLKLLNSLETIKLYNNELPSREYSTSLGVMTSGGVVSKTGDGWSALDIGRLLVWLKITENWYPNYKTKIEKIVSKWSFKRLSKDNKLNGTILTDKETLRQEGRLGYEQYSASGFYQWGVIIPNALDYDKTKKIKLWDLEISVDTRNLAYLTSEPFFLAKMELGKVDNNFDYMFKQLYELQKKRFEKYNVLTAFTEDSLDVYPWFVYNAIHFNNKSWVCTSPSGKEYPNLKSISTKASFAFDSIFNDDYSKKLKEKVQNNFGDFGYYTGIYEKTGDKNKSVNINTNAVILESLLYKKLGKKAFIDK